MSITIRQWKNTGYIIRLKGHNIFYIDSLHGSPPEAPRRGTILLLHGYPTSSWDWERIWPLLEPNYRLIALDFLGLGFSDKPYPYEYLITEQADIVEALIDKLGLINFHVMSHDYGDTVAQELLARQNERDETQWLSLCLLNGGILPEAHRAKWIQKLLATPLGPYITKHFTSESLKKAMVDIFGPETPPDDELIAGFWEAINNNNGRHTLHKLISYIKQRKLNRERWVGALQETKIPIGMINGSLDPISGRHMVARYKEVIGPPLMTIALETIGHYPQLESPEQTVAAYTQILEAVTQCEG